MQEDQNQNNQNISGNDPQNRGFSTNPTQANNQEVYDQSYSNPPQSSNPFDYQNQSVQNPQSAPYSTDFTNLNGVNDYPPTGTNINNTTQTAFDNSAYQPFGPNDIPTTTVPPLDEQFPNSTPTPSTFEEKKSGSKIFLYGSIAVVVVLLIAMGVLSYFNFFANRGTDTNQDATTQTEDTSTSDSNDTNSEDSTSDSEVIVDDGSTGGATTPASQARVNSDTEISKDWLIKNFTRPDVDTTGICLNLSVCGNQADPDNDGSTNIIEYNFETDPLNNDTDGDLLADGDELFVYFTNPNSELSDSDTFADGVEITGCYDPTASATTKTSTQRRSQIASNVTLRPLHEPTISLLKDAAATQSDIINRGVPLAACPADTTPTETSN